MVSPLLTRALYRGECSASHPSYFILRRKGTQYPLYEWVGPRAGLDTTENAKKKKKNSYPSWELNHDSSPLSSTSSIIIIITYILQ
jgi:hypothetical protein